MNIMCEIVDVVYTKCKLTSVREQLLYFFNLVMQLKKSLIRFQTLTGVCNLWSTWKQKPNKTNYRHKILEKKNLKQGKNLITLTIARE